MRTNCEQEVWRSMSWKLRSDKGGTVEAAGAADHVDALTTAGANGSRDLGGAVRETTAKGARAVAAVKRAVENATGSRKDEVAARAGEVVRGRSRTARALAVAGAVALLAGIAAAARRIRSASQS